MAITTLSADPRLGTTAEWAASTLVLGDGELGFDTTANQFKFGDGVNVWSALPAGDAASVQATNTVAAAGATETLPAVSVATMHNLGLDANCTITFPTPVAGATLTLKLTQDATGSRLVTWDATVKWPAATAPTLSTGAGKVDMFSFISVGGTTWSGRTLGLDIR